MEPSTIHEQDDKGKHFDVELCMHVKITTVELYKKLQYVET